MTLRETDKRVNEVGKENKNEKRQRYTTENNTLMQTRKGQITRRRVAENTYVKKTWLQHVFGRFPFCTLRNGEVNYTASKIIDCYLLKHKVEF